MAFGAIKSQAVAPGALSLRLALLRGQREMRLETPGESKASNILC
jgi:hypothetical protein